MEHYPKSFVGHSYKVQVTKAAKYYRIDHSALLLDLLHHNFSKEITNCLRRYMHDRIASYAFSYILKRLSFHAELTLRSIHVSFFQTLATETFVEASICLHRASFVAYTLHKNASSA
jgi:hypothetical protein